VPISLFQSVVNLLNQNQSVVTMNNQELKIQSDFFIWHWNNFPQERGLLHANNNNSQNAIKGNQNMAIGVVAGVADMEYNRNGKTIFIEWKTPTGTQSDKQKAFQALVESQGFEYIILRSIEEGKQFIYEQHSDKVLA